MLLWPAVPSNAFSRLPLLSREISGMCCAPLPLTFSLCCALFGGSLGSLCFRFGGVGYAPLPLALVRCRALFWGVCCQPLPRPFSLCRALFGGLISKHDSYPGRPSASGQAATPLSR